MNASMLYKEREAYFSIKAKRQLQRALKGKKQTLAVSVQPSGAFGGGKATLLLTKRQIANLEKGRKHVLIKMSKR